MPNNQQLYDKKQLRAEASKSMLQGAVTPAYPLDLQEVYRLLNEALASEILCVLRYRHHQIVAKGIDWPQVAAQFKEHAKEEEEHMLMIAQRIDQLGGDPDFNPANVTQRSVSEYGSSGADVPLDQLIQEDLVAERIVIEVYHRLINFFELKDPTSRRMFEKLLQDEEDHANDLSNLLAAISPREKPQG